MRACAQVELMLFRTDLLLDRDIKFNGFHDSIIISRYNHLDRMRACTQVELMHFQADLLLDRDIKFNGFLDSHTKFVKGT